MSKSSAARTMGVIGAGGIGLGVAADFVLHGFDVVLVDTDESRLKQSKDELVDAVRYGPMIRRELPRMDTEEALRRVVFTTRVEEVAECEFVVENVTESWEVKRVLYGRLDAVLPPDVGIGVNTSSIPIGRLAAETSRAERVIGIHFMNPSYLKDAVEVMRGDATSDECLTYVLELLDQLGKSAVVVGDFPGFVSNRISHLFFNEAIRVVEEQGVAPATVDAVFKKCFGHSMGPLETADLIGLDTVALTLDHLHESYGEDKFRCAGLLRDMVAEGRLGRKAGEGFYRYRPQQRSED
ncbi:3-hydroxyacyl-CoA dehydrogenase family protein [Streptomyces sp. NPDC050732]|uniref:3-hydroxyacyl-CoA dehydrogenase family protein n=1 Tax=Streptomyces sp. NPDC050732 TaxID=3154632 RepID=UPI003414734B